MPLRATAKNILRDWPLLTALAISFLAAALRIPPLRESLWLDELHTAWCAVGPLDEVARRAAIGNQAPLFFWLEWFLANLIGPSEFSLRFVSLFSGSLLPLALFLFARRWQLVSAGIIAAALIGVDHRSIFYSTEARPYALLQLLAVIHIAITAEIAACSSPRMRITWIALAATMFYVHYTSALVIGAEAAFLFVSRLVEIRRLLAEHASPSTNLGISDVLIDLAAVGLLCLPQLGSLRHVFARRDNWAAFISQQPLWEAIDWTPLPDWWWTVLILGCGIAAFLPRTSEARHKLESRGSIAVLVVWSFAGPLLLAWLASRAGLARLFFPRYVAGALPITALVAGLCVGAMRPFVPRVVVGLATIACAAWSSGIGHQLARDGRVIADRTEDWRGCVAWLNERIAQDGYPVLVYSGLIEADELTKPHDALLDEYCLSPVNSLYPLDTAPSDMFPLPYHNPGQLPQTAEQLVFHRGGCWLIVRGRKELAQKLANQICQSLKHTAADGGSEFTIRQTQSFRAVQALHIASRD